MIKYNKSPPEKASGRAYWQRYTEDTPFYVHRKFSTETGCHSEPHSFAPSGFLSGLSTGLPIFNRSLALAPMPLHTYCFYYCIIVAELFQVPLSSNHPVFQNSCRRPLVAKHPKDCSFLSTCFSSCSTGFFELPVKY